MSSGLGILDALGADGVAEVLSEIVPVPGTSLTVFERDGRIAFDRVESGWCQFLRRTSRAGEPSCEGCHGGCLASSWGAAREAIETGSEIDRPCDGGLVVHALPINAGGRVVGAIAHGHGATTPESATAIARALDLPIEEAVGAARAASIAADSGTLELVRRQAAVAARILGGAVRRASSVESAVLLASIVHDSLDAIYRLTPEGRIVSWNASAERVYRCASLDAIGTSFTRFVPPDREKEFLGFLEQIREGRGVAGIETERVCGDGERIHINLTMSPLRGSDGQVAGASVIARDVSERRGWEARLAASERRFRRLLESSVVGVIVTGAQGLVLEANDAFLEMTGRSRDDLAAGLVRWDEMTPPELRELDRRAARSLAERGVAHPWATEYVRKDGSRVPVLVGVVALGASTPEAELLAIVVDRSSLEKAESARAKVEEQLRQAQKMESIGRLAGGIAHDFNNVLTAVTGYSELVLAKLDARDPLHRDVTEIKKAGDRAASLTRQLLAFSRKQNLQPRVVCLNPVVADIEQMLRRIIGEQVELRVVRDLQLGAARVDPTQLEQIVVNLAVNARDAMAGGGTLTIETSNVSLDEEYARSHADVVAGRYVMLAVSDTGTGMDAETLRKIFEPFFTTKPEDKGTGLGLSTVYGIVKQSGGHVSVYSEPGRGTTFKVYFPRVDELPTPGPPACSRNAPRGTEKILVVEDDELVTQLVRALLVSHGYDVVTARDGSEALLLSEQSTRSIDLVLTDVVLPGQDGHAVWQRLRARRPGLRVIFMSGYTENAIAHQGPLDGRTAFIEKPFATRALLAKVREVLDTA